MELVKRFFKAPQKSFFLFGPRGSGKSTWLKMNYPKACFIDLLEPELFRQYNAFPERLKELVSTKPSKKIFVIDEVQKVPQLLSVVHLLLEKHKDIMFILTGSSSRKLKRAGVDLLASRAQLKILHPFIASELKTKFNMKQALELGMLPLIMSSNDPKGDLKTYVALYMREEVQMEGIVRNLEHFSRFLEVMSLSQGSTTNYSNIARDCYISNKSVENYIAILEDLLLCFNLSVFEKKAKRFLIKHKKFYYFDSGVYQSMRPKGILDTPDEISGIALETLVAQHLRAWLDYSEKDGQLFFWRTKAGLEVDFIVYGEIGFWAIEVKNTTNIHPQHLKALHEFKKDYPESKAILVYRGKETLVKKDITCIPCEKFLKEIIPL